MMLLMASCFDESPLKTSLQPQTLGDLGGPRISPNQMFFHFVAPLSAERLVIHKQSF